MAAKAANLGPELMRFVEKSMLLQMLDAVWKEHLLALDHLRQGIGLRAYGQRDPLNEYKSEAFALFNAMLDDLKERVTTMLARVELGRRPRRPSRCSAPPCSRRRHQLQRPGGGGALCRRRRAGSRAPAHRPGPGRPQHLVHTPRNAPCPCGSGKKYKHCHGKIS